jgi:hypothetical protein
MDASHALARPTGSPVAMAPGQTMHQQLQHSVPRGDGSANGQGMMYSNEVTADLSANSHHTQMSGSHQSEELYKRSVMLVIWYKVRSILVNACVIWAYHFIPFFLRSVLCKSRFCFYLSMLSVFYIPQRQFRRVQLARMLNSALILSDVLI